MKILKTNWLWVVPMVLMALVGLHLTINAGDVGAESQGSTLLKNRYGVTATVEELNIMDGVTATATELNYVDGVTSAIQTQLDAKTTSSLADTKIFIGSASGVATAQTIGTGHSLTNAGAMTHIANTVSSTDILNGTILGIDMAANSVTTSQAFINTVTLLVANTATTNTVTVDSGHVLMGYYLSTVGGINGTNMVNTLTYEGSGVWRIAMVNALSGGDAVWTLNFLSDN